MSRPAMLTSRPAATSLSPTSARDSGAKQASLAEDLAEAGAARDAELLTLATALVEAVPYAGVAALGILDPDRRGLHPLQVHAHARGRLRPSTGPRRA
jgi:hypothetical protein